MKALSIRMEVEIGGRHALFGAGEYVSPNGLLPLLERILDRIGSSEFRSSFVRDSLQFRTLLCLKGFADFRIF